MQVQNCLKLKILLSKCAVCGNEKSRFMKKQVSKGLLSSLGFKTPLNKIPLLGDIFLKKLDYV